MLEFLYDYFIPFPVKIYTVLFTFFVYVFNNIVKLKLFKERGTFRPSEKLLETLDGEYVKLSNDTNSSTQKRYCIFVHGVGSGYNALDRISKELSSIGLTVILFDLYGRGSSDAPNLPNSLNLFASQINDLIISLFPIINNDQVILAGVSMGGAVITRYASLYPYRIYRQNYSDSEIVDNKEYIYMQVKEGRFLRNNHPGFMRSFLSTARYTLRHNIQSDYKQINDNNHPILVIWGDKDRVCSYKNIFTLKELLPKAKYVVISNGSHSLIHMNAKEVASEIEMWLDDKIIDV